MKTIIYKSKVDWWVVLIPIFILGAEVAIFIHKGIWLGMIILSVVSILILPIFFRTYYSITGDNSLVIKCGFILNYKIGIDKIYSINSSGSYESSPALSFDRIAIHYYEDKNRHYVLISPLDKKGFINELKNRNNTINVTV